MEKCNWDLECIKLWDANTAFFTALPKEDQMKMIAMKDREEAEAALDAAPAAAPEQVPAFLQVDFEAGDSGTGAGDSTADVREPEAVPQGSIPVLDAAALAFMAGLEEPIVAAEAPQVAEAPEEESNSEPLLPIVLPIPAPGNAEGGTTENAVSEPAEKSEILPQAAQAVAAEPDGPEAKQVGSEDTNASHSLPVAFDSVPADTSYAGFENAGLVSSDTAHADTVALDGEADHS